MTDNYEDIFATLDLDAETLKIGHGETITPTVTTASRQSTAMEELPRFTLETRAITTPADYRIVERLGEGGMGIVSLAEQTALRRLVAVKEPKGKDDESHGRVLDEAFVMGQVEHPNVVPAYGLGRRQDGKPILVMKRVEGTSWEDVLTGSSEPPGGGQADLLWHLRVLLQVCNALRFAHARRIVHRDIKPENVMVGEFGEVYLLDWGIALSCDPDSNPGLPNHETAQGVAGTPAFMAPEMTIDDASQIDERTDIYLLGANLHMLLTGEAPHSGGSLFAICMDAYRSEPKEYGPDVPTELAEAAKRAMAREKEDRWQSVAEFAAAITDYIEHRASYQLSDAAEQTLEEAFDATDDAETSSKLLEAEFGFRQAMKIWDENVRASDGLQRAVELRVKTAIEREELGAARAALEHLPRPNLELESAVDELERSLSERAERVDYLERFERELDLRTGTRSRQRAIIMLGLAFVGLCVLSAWRARPGQPEAPIESWLYGYWRILAIASAVLIIFWKKLTSNVANRRLLLHLCSALAALFFLRYGAVELAAPELFLLVSELGVMGVVAAAVGITSSKRLAALSLSYAVAAGAAIYTAELWIAYISYAVAHVIYFSFMAWIWRPSASRGSSD